MLPNSSSASSGGLGSLSKKYESGSSGAGTVAHTPGDRGGASYGTYQISTNTGAMSSFLNYLKKADPSIYQSLAHYGAGTSNFDSTWKALAQNYGSRFDSLQHNYIQGAYYTPAVNNLKSALGIDLSKRSSALQNVVWSASVQHGVPGSSRLFKNAGITNSMSDADIIKRIYAERSASNGAKYFGKSSVAIRNSVVNRFKSELNDALRMLG